MAHDTPRIVAEPRERIGSRYAQRLRRDGRLPAIIYGHNETPVAVSFDHKELVTHVRDGAHLVEVVIGDSAGAGETCLVKELQFGFLGDDVIHVDLARVSLDEEVEVSVALRFTGECAAAAQPGAILSHNLTQLEIACKANAIPEDIVVDESALTGTLTVGDLRLPPGVRCTLDPATVVASISFVQEEVEGEAAEVAEAAAPEVISEARKDEEGQEG